MSIGNKLGAVRRTLSWTRVDQGFGLQSFSYDIPSGSGQGSTARLWMHSCAGRIKDLTAISPLGVAWQSPNLDFRRLLWNQPSPSLL